MTIRLRENNKLDVAASWLSEQCDDFEGYQPEDIIEDALLGKINPWVAIPEWQTTGELDWIRHDKIIDDTKTGAYTVSTSADVNFLCSDGRVRLTAEMARRLLDHGECSLDCVQMPIIDCTSGPPDTSVTSFLRGIGDGRLITLEHIRVSRNELIAFASTTHEPAIEPMIEKRPKLIGVSSNKILGAPWQYPSGFDEKHLAGLLNDKPKWILPALLSRGTRGGDSATWNPATLATLLHDRKNFSINSLSRVINSHFDHYLEEWNIYVDICR